MRVAASLLVALLAVSAGADEVRSFGQGDGRVPPRALGSHRAQLSHSEGYFERWMVMVNRKDGGWMQLSFVITNIGPGSGNAVVDLMRVGPPFNGGKAGFYRWPKKIDRDDWHAAESGIDIRTSAGHLKTTQGGLTGSVSIWGYELELTLKSTGPQWRPGDGRAQLHDGGRFEVQLAPVLAEVTGRERTHEGEWRTFTGTAWVEHGVTNVMPQLLSDRFLRAHATAGPYAMAFMQIELPAALGRERMGWLVVTRGKEVVTSVLDPKVEIVKTRRDPKHPNHVVPTGYRITGLGKHGEVGVDVATSKLVHREDVLGVMPAWLRSVVRMFVQPINYFHRARVEIRLPDEPRLRGQGMSLFSPMRAP